MNARSRRSLTNPFVHLLWTLQAVLFPLLFFLAQAQANPGDLDLSFGENGKVTTDIGSAHSSFYDVDRAEAVAAQSDGKIIVVGRTRDSQLVKRIVVARYLSSGSPDPSFGSGGRVITGLGSGEDIAAALLIQPDGKILVSGSTYRDATGYDFALIRYNADGTRDAGFGTGGVVTTNITRDDWAASLALQADGKIVVAGYTDNFRDYNAVFSLVRYHPNGAIDTGFGVDGKVTTDIGAGPENISSVLIQQDQKIIAVGTLDGRYFALARYDASGALDPTFGTGGIATTPIGMLYNAYDQARSAALQPDGKIVVAGFAWYKPASYQTNNDVVVARFNPNGTLDAGFGNGGRVFTDIEGGTDEMASGVALQGDKIIVAGSIYRSSALTRRSQFDFLLLRYLSDGGLDAGFGAGGHTLTDFGSGEDDQAFALSLQTDGKIILAGESYHTGTNRDFGLARYLGDSVDTAPPATVAALSPNPNAAGWNNADVRITLTATDPAGGSGVKEIRYTIGEEPEVIVPGDIAEVDLRSEGISTIRYHAVDHAERVEAPHLLTVRIDKTGPNVISSQLPIANSSGWNNTGVNVQFEGADAYSGGVSCTPAAVSVTAEGADQSVGTVCIDASGNRTSATRTVRIDKSAPRLTLPSLASSYLLNSTISPSFGASDALSGLSSVLATLDGSAVPSGAPIKVNRVGLHTFSLMAFDQAGNSSGRSVTFTVGYRFSGFLPPLTAGGGRSVFELGSTIPVKFRLTDAGGSPISSAVARLSLQSYSDGQPVGGSIDGTSVGAATGNLFRFDGSHYSYNLDTGPLSAGTWLLWASLDDGSVHAVEIELKSKQRED